MKRRIFALFAGLAFAGAVSAQTTLNVITAGDQNMVDYVNNYLAPKFEAANPGVKVRAVGTGPGDAGSQKIYEKLSAQQKAGNNEWDVDVAVIHQLAGADVDGYVLPMFHSQIVFAYNPDLVKNPPRSFAELNDWVKKNPKQFGYNGVKGGMSGVGFVTGWVSAYSGMADKLEKGPYDPSAAPAIDKALAGLKDFNQYVVLTPGNAGTLDMLNRGEIAMGPVWVDMFYTWQADGRMSPKIKLVLPSPGLPGQPMYYVIPAKAAHAALAKKFIELAESPEVQADGIVKQFNWYPGIDPQYVQPKLDQAAWNKLFTDITPQDLSKYGRPFPLSPYFKEITEGYERVVIK